MSSLKADFDELRERIRHGRELGHASFEPIYYLVFHPSQILEVKRQTPAWIARLRNEGWEVTTFSIAEAHRGRPAKRSAPCAVAHRRPPGAAELDQDQPVPGECADSNGALQRRLEASLTSLEGASNALLLVTDLEALHPYLRIGSIEGQLQGKFHVPTVFLYPGIRSRQDAVEVPRLLSRDGNYRSVHVGG